MVKEHRHFVWPKPSLLPWTSEDLPLPASAAEHFLLTSRICIETTFSPSPNYLRLPQPESSLAPWFLVRLASAAVYELYLAAVLCRCIQAPSLKSCTRSTVWWTASLSSWADNPFSSFSSLRKDLLGFDLRLCSDGAPHFDRDQYPRHD